MRGHPHRRGLKGQGDRKGRPYHTTKQPVQPVYGRGRACPCPAGAASVRAYGGHPLSPPAAASKKRKKGFSGTARAPAGGRRPLEPRPSFVKLTPKGDTPSPGRGRPSPAPLLYSLASFCSKIYE